MKTGSLTEVQVGYEAGLMSRFTLDMIRSIHGEKYAGTFRADIEQFTRQHPTDKWVKTWAANQGTALDCFAWDQDQDFGEGLSLEGAMGAKGAAGASHTRGLLNAARLREAGVPLAEMVKGRKCCVVGSWCGYETLLLSAMGAVEVDAIEEIPTFAAWTIRQKEAFGVGGNMVEARSLYDLSSKLLSHPDGHYDVIYCPGVLYHCSDVACAIAILRLLLRPGGVLLFETMALPNNNPVGPAAQYRGPSVVGWNWWIPTGQTWVALTTDMGFDNAVQVDFRDGRAWIVGSASTKTSPLIASGAAGFARTDILDIMRVKFQ